MNNTPHRLATFITNKAHCRKYADITHVAILIASAFALASTAGHVVIYLELKKFYTRIDKHKSSTLIKT